MESISGWGRYPVVLADEQVGEDLEKVTRNAVLSRGLGRSYGDASLPATEGAIVAGTRMADRILSFDSRTGALRAEAGLSLARLNALLLHRGWSSPVLPGTQFVTLGGMVAADVHGKNHHVAGSIGEHVQSLRLRVADGRILEINERNEPELLRATIGGMGLTGHILEVELRLERVPSPWIWQETERVDSIDQLLERLRRASADWPYTVSWVDGLRRGQHMGRGILIKGRWARPEEAPAGLPGNGRPLAVPFEMPSWVLGRPVVRAFNAAYYGFLGPRKAAGIVHPRAFFYPLDAIQHWNLIYGRRGFTQYQCVLPPGDDSAPRRVLDRLTRGDGSSFLSVVKDFGRSGKGMLSFPMPGVTFSLDLPLRGEKTQRLVDDLNQVVIDSGGRIYLAKDTLTRPEHYRAMDPRLDAWNEIRRRWDPSGRMMTALSARLLGDSA
jgi:FAD/FMN-containing dehydrogenase